MLAARAQLVEPVPAAGGVRPADQLERAGAIQPAAADQVRGAIEDLIACERLELVALDASRSAKLLEVAGEADHPTRAGGVVDAPQRQPARRTAAAVCAAAGASRGSRPALAARAAGEARVEFAPALVAQARVRAQDAGLLELVNRAAAPAGSARRHGSSPSSSRRSSASMAAFASIAAPFGVASSLRPPVG